MNRRGFVKALAALPAVVGGLISIPKAASPVRIAHPADAAGISPKTFDAFLRRIVHLRVLEENAVGRLDWRAFESVDPFDDWLDFVGQGQYASGVEPVRFQVGVDLAGKDARDLTVYLDSREIEFHREAVVGRISQPKLLTDSGRDIRISIDMQGVDVDRMSEMMTLWAAEAEEAARRCQESIDQMVFRSIVPDDASPEGLHRTSKSGRLA